MAKLTRDDVLKLAHLARLQLSEAEIANFPKELSDILAYVEQLRDVKVDNLGPTNQVSGLVNVTRDDEVKDYGYDPKELLKNVPKVKDDQIVAKRMVN